MGAAGKYCTKARPPARLPTRTNVSSLPSLLSLAHLRAGGLAAALAAQLRQRLLQPLAGAQLLGQVLLGGVGGGEGGGVTVEQRSRAGLGAVSGGEFSGTGVAVATGTQPHHSTSTHLGHARIRHRLVITHRHKQHGQRGVLLLDGVPRLLLRQAGRGGVWQGAWRQIIRQLKDSECSADTA